MGNNCVKSNNTGDVLDMRDEKSRRQYYLNMQGGGEPGTFNEMSQ